VATGWLDAASEILRMPATPSYSKIVCRYAGVADQTTESRGELVYS